MAATDGHNADSVALSFDWPTGLKGTVTYAMTKKKTVNDEVYETVINGRYRLSTSEARGGLLISAGDVQLSVTSDEKLPGLQEKLRDLLIKATSAPPSYIVNRDGEYIRLAGLDRFHANVQAGMAEFVGDLPEQAQTQISQIVQAALSKEQLEAGIVADWNRTVGTWVGAELDRGDTYEAEYVDTIPLFGDLPIPMKARFRFVDRVNCGPRDKRESCVDLEMRTFVDPDALADAVQSFMDRVGPEGESASIDDIQSTTVTRIVTEPDTLLPHRMRITSITASVFGFEGDHRGAREVEEIDLIYKYN